MRKRILILLLCIVMCLSLMPTAVFAAETLTELHITGSITSVEAGELPAIDAEVAPGEHASVQPYFYGSGTWWTKNISGEWHDVGSNTIAENDGTRYAMRLCVETESGYSITNETKIFYNGSEISGAISFISDWGAYVEIDLGTAGATPRLIHNVTVTGFESIAAGKTAGQLSHLSIPEGADYFFDPDYRDGGYSEWSLVEDGKSLVENRMLDTAAFAVGKTYSEGRALVAKSGYAFADDCTFIAKDKYGSSVAIDTVNTRVAGSSYAFIYSKPEQIVTNYPVWVSGVRVSSANASDVLNDGGKVTFEVKDGTPTLNIAAGANINTVGSGGLIYSSMSGGLTINAPSGLTLSTTGSGYGILMNDIGPLTINGDVNISTQSVCIDAPGNVTINGDVVLKSSSREGIRAGRDISVNGSVNVQAGAYGLFSSNGNISISKDVTIKSSYNGIVASNGTVTIASGATWKMDSSGYTIIAKDIVIPSGSAIIDPADGEISEGGSSKHTPSEHVIIGPAVVKYTVTFNMNGHGTQVPAQTVEEGNKATKPADPSASGYTFDGWYADATFSAKFDFSYAINANTTVYAKWTEVKKDEPTKPADPTIPKTGDNSHLFIWVALLLISGGALAGTAVYGKKRKYNAK